MKSFMQIVTIYCVFCILKLTNAQDTCATTNLQATPGTPQQITSRNYPSTYNSRENCWWIITAPTGFQIVLNILDFNTELCCDKLKIYNSSTARENRNQQIQDLFGTITNRPPIYSPSNFVALNFRSDSSVSFKGFLLTYQAIEVGSNGVAAVLSLATTTLATPEGECRTTIQASPSPRELTPPGFPGLYRSNLNCEWRIVGAPGTRVQLTLGNIRTQSCCDHIEVIDDGQSLNSFSGTNNNVFRYLSRTSAGFIITFRTDESVNRDGFLAVYRRVSENAPVRPLSLHAACGSNTTATTRAQAISSPNWPGFYPEMIDCEWNIASSGDQYQILFAITRYNIQPQGDYLQLFENGRSIARVTGQMTSSQTFTTNGANLRVVFVSNSSSPRQGFQATYRLVRRALSTTPTSIIAAAATVPTIRTCQVSQLQAREGAESALDITRVVTSGAELNCWWTIRAPRGSFVRLTFTDFQMESCCDSIKIYNSLRQLHDSSTLIKELKGHEITPQVAYSTNSYLTLSFSSSSRDDPRGFRTIFDAVGKPCGFNDHVTISRIKNLNSPGYPNNYPPSFNCEWRLTTTPGRVVQFTVGELLTEPCCDALEIWEAGTRRERIRGSVETSTSFVSSSSSGFVIKFISDRSVSRKGFRGVYSSSPSDNVNPLVVPSDCGFTALATGSEKNVSSPGWGIEEQYENDLNCFWNLNAESEGFQVQLTVLQGRTETCCDYLDVFEGSTLLGKVKGAISSPQNFVSSNGSLRLLFHTDRDQAFAGFFAIFQEVPTPTTALITTSLATQANCGFTRTATNTSQFFTSPNNLSPTVYDPNTQCVWNLQAESNTSVVQITFHNFDTEPCCDYVKLFEGDNEIAWIRGRYRTSRKYTTKGQSLRVEFRSDRSDQRSGFNASFWSIDAPQLSAHILSATSNESAACGFKTTALDDPRKVASPEWPGLYPNSARCNWTISVPAGWMMQINFTTFETEACCDWLELSNDTGLVRKLQGREQDVSLLISSENLYLLFQSDANIRTKGFEAVFVGIPPETTTTPQPTTPAYVCGGEVHTNGSSAVLMSDGYPWFYRSLSNCTWTLYAEEGYHVLVNFSVVSLEECCDYIEVFDGIDGKSLEKIYDESIPANRIYVSSGHVMQIRLISDVNIAGKGFLASVEQTPGAPAYPCGSRIFLPATSTELKSTNYPLNYTTKTECNWTLAAPAGRRVVINFTDFEVEPCCDKILIYDGPGRRLIAEVRQNNIQYSRVFESTSSVLIVSFYSDWSVTNRGFLADVYSTPAEYVMDRGACGFYGVAAQRSLQFHSPNYPYKYPSQSECHWLIVALETFKQVQLSLNDFRFENMTDYLEVRDGSNEQAPMVSTIKQGYRGKKVFSSTSGSLYLKFKTDRTGEFRGFHASYQLVSTPTSCGSKLSATKNATNIMSDNYPDVYPDNQNCSWQLHAPEGQRIVLVFTSMEMETCCDYIEITDGTDDRLIANVTRFSIESNLIYSSSTNLMRVRFHSDKEIGKRGFTGYFYAVDDSATYDPSSCGFTSTATNVFQSFHSPNYSSNNPVETNCHWLILARDPLRQVELDIHNFLVESCCASVEIRDGRNVHAPLITILNHTLREDDAITSKSGALYITLNSDVKWPHRGFNASFKQVAIEEKYSNSCYSILKAYAGHKAQVETRLLQHCPTQSKCLLAKSVHGSRSVTYGACVPASICPVATCAEIEDLLMRLRLPFSMDFSDCDLSCCSDDNCNDDEPITTPQVLPTTGTTTIPNTPDNYGCWRRFLDVMFLLDGSGSVDPIDFTETIKFLQQFIFPLDLKTTRVGVMQYSHWYRNRPMTTAAQTYLKTHISIGQYKDATKLQDALGAIFHYGYTSYAAHAIEKAITIDFAATGKFSDPCTSQVIVLISDGRATDANYLATTAGLGRALGITFIAVGVKDYRLIELQVIANGRIGVDDRVFTVDNAVELHTLEDQIKTELTALKRAEL